MTGRYAPVCPVMHYYRHRRESTLGLESTGNDGGVELDSAAGTLSRMHPDGGNAYLDSGWKVESHRYGKDG